MSVLDRYQRKIMEKLGKSRTRDIPGSTYSMYDAVHHGVIIDRRIHPAYTIETSKEGPMIGIQYAVTQALEDNTTARTQGITFRWSEPSIPSQYTRKYFDVKTDGSQQSALIHLPLSSATPGFKLIIEPHGDVPYRITLIPYSTSKCVGFYHINLLPLERGDTITAHTCEYNEYIFAGRDGSFPLKRVYVLDLEGNPIANTPIHIVSNDPTRTHQIIATVNTTASGLLQLGFDATRSHRGASLELTMPKGVPSLLLLRFE